MAKKKKKDNPFDIPAPEKYPETKPYSDPKEPVIPEEYPEKTPNEEPFERPPSEIPAPDEGTKTK